MNDLHKCIVLTAPSGAGKTTIKKYLLETYPDIFGFSVSATTRSARGNEEDGVDYYFLSPDEFKEKITSGDMLEYEEVYENQFYGTLKSEVDRIWSQNKCVIFDIDVKGAENIKATYGSQCLAIFVQPPSLNVLIERLKARNTESDENLRKRIARVKEEMSYKNRFDKIIVNDVLEDAYREASKLIEQYLALEK
ncbi:guanylate kinase [Membranihabitans marinus]|uniref:guanylate kinase n=1 Tax=Membranihabitans marinus TaxID=1227546 RepID=UPI001F031672|nr:guanylate kinase [Membranihabitans marinus]